MICLNIHNVFFPHFFRRLLLFLWFQCSRLFIQHINFFDGIRFDVSFIAFGFYHIFVFQLPCMFVSVVETAVRECAGILLDFDFESRLTTFRRLKIAIKKTDFLQSKSTHFKSVEKKKKKRPKIANEYDESKQNMFPVMTNTAHIAWYTNIWALWQKWRIL